MIVRRAGSLVNAAETGGEHSRKRCGNFVPVRRIVKGTFLASLLIVKFRDTLRVQVGAPIEFLAFKLRYDYGGSRGLMGRVGMVRQFILVAGFALMLAGAGTAAVADPAAIIEGNHPDEAVGIVGVAAAPARPLAMSLTMAIRNRA